MMDQDHNNHKNRDYSILRWQILEDSCLMGVLATRFLFVVLILSCCGSESYSEQMVEWKGEQKGTIFLMHSAAGDDDASVTKVDSLILPSRSATSAHRQSKIPVAWRCCQWRQRRERQWWGIGRGHQQRQCVVQNHGRTKLDTTF